MELHEDELKYVNDNRDLWNQLILPSRNLRIEESVDDLQKFFTYVVEEHLVDPQSTHQVDLQTSKE